MSNLIKWSGSKDSQAKTIIEFFPRKIDIYYEPFLGGGSVFLKLLESDWIINKFILSDLNEELIGIYNLIKNDPNKLIDTYKKHYKDFNLLDIQHRKNYFNEIRTNFNINRNPEDFYWIMRTTTNGMPRYNRKGYFNNSCHFSRPGMEPKDVSNLILKYHNLFKNKDITFINQSYENMNITQNDLIYMDPPYTQTKGMYFGGFDNTKFIKWLNNLECNWCLSYDGKVNDEKVKHTSPNYKRHEYLISGNSSFRRVIGNSNDSIIHESLYINY